MPARLRTQRLGTELPARRRASAPALVCRLLAAWIATGPASPGAMPPGPAGPTVALDPFEIIAHPTGADERTASVWVVAPESGAPAPARTADLLLRVPGMHVDRAGGPGGRSTVYLRGMEENHTLILLDGVPLNDPTDSRGGGVDVSALEPALLRQVAVVRGPASVRHGPEVVGGIVHLETSGNGPDPAALGAEIGGDDTRRGHARGGIAPGDGSHLNLGIAASDEGSREDGGRTRLGFARASLALADPVELRLAAWHGRHRAEAFPDDSGGPRLAVVRELELRDETRTALALRAAAAGMGGRWTFTADGLQSEVKIENPGVAPGVRDPAGLPPVTSDTRLRRFRASFLVDYTMEGGTLAWGVDAQREAGRDDSEISFGAFSLPTGFRLTRTRGGVFAEGTRALGGGVLLAGGARYDRFDGEFGRGTARLGLLGTLREKTTQWRLNAGTAFKPPSFYGLAHPLVGNPDLAPESARTLEAGLRHAVGDGRGLLDFTLFTTRVRNAVDFDPGPPPRIVNRDGLRSRGAELAFVLRATPAVTLTGSAAYLETESEPEGAQMRSRPRWRGAIAVEWRPQPALTLSARATSVGSVPDSSIPTGDVRLGGWARLDLAARVALGRGLAATAAIDNALDREYEEVVGFPAQGRRLRLGLEAAF